MSEDGTAPDVDSELVVRRFRPDDAERLARVQVDALSGAGAYIEGDSVVNLDDEDVVGTYLDTGGEFLVGLIDDRPVACGAFRPPTGPITRIVDLGPDDGPDGGFAELKRMYVDPAFHRRGIGSRLLDDLAERARRTDWARGFVLLTTEMQTAAQAFYEGRGYEAIGRHTIEEFDEPFDVIAYRKRLD